MMEDTSFIIDVVHHHSDALAYLDPVETSNRPEKVVAITVLDLYEAVPQLDVPEERQQRILEVLDTRHAVPADDTIMRKAGRISGTLLARDEEIDREDCIVGATALFNDEPVVTRNSDRFERIDGLDVETYRATVLTPVSGDRIIAGREQAPSAEEVFRIQQPVPRHSW